MFIKERALNYLPNFNLGFYINNDASDTGIGAVYIQPHGVVDHFAKKLSETEQRYSTTEKESYAMLRFACGWKKTCLVIVLEPAISASKQDIQFTFLSLLLTVSLPNITKHVSA